MNQFIEKWTINRSIMNLLDGLELVDVLVALEPEEADEAEVADGG